jgi:hypothetical protein
MPIPPYYNMLKKALIIVKWNLKNVFSSPSQITEVIFMLVPTVVKTAVSKGHGLGESDDYERLSWSPILYTLKLKIRLL